VLLLGGASGVGKTSVSYRLASYFGVGICEVDDLFIVLERMTTPEQYPELHHYRLDPDEIAAMTEAEHLAALSGISRVMTAALEPVIANHIETGTPIILEGDFIQPSLAVRPVFGETPAAGQVRAIFLYEDEDQIARNLHVREGGEQRGRARVSWRYGQWLCREAERFGIPTVATRPWETVLERVIAALEPAGQAEITPGPGVVSLG